MSTPIEPWNAQWIGYSDHPRDELGFFEFQCEFELASVPESLLIRISADQRYALLVNGTMSVRGPQRGDAEHWHYETFDLAPMLVAGKNVLRAEVHNFGRLAPMAQHSVRTAFVVEAGEEFTHLSTPGLWQVRKRNDRDFAMMHDGVGEFYIDVGPGEVFIINNEEPEPWGEPHVIGTAQPRGMPGGGFAWSLIPRTIPLIPERPKVSAVTAVVRSKGQSKELPSEFSDEPIEIKAGEELILDFGELLTAYPSLWLTTESPGGDQVRITYCESLWENEREKGQRDQIADKTARGYEDLIRLEGANHGSIHPSWWRTFRFVSIRPTADISVTFEAIPAEYESNFQSKFQCDDSQIDKVWDISLRTLRLCAGETYFDCPYYEQLQYIGDTRLQALIGFYLGRDRSLQRNAINQFHWSIQENGLTYSRYPSKQLQVIPPFSLWWIVMLYDAWMHDPEFEPRPYFRSAQTVIEAYTELFQDRLEPFWCFGDWVPEWKWGIPPRGSNAEMHRILLQFAMWCFMQISGLDYGVQRPPRGIDEAVTEHAEALWRYWQVLAGEEPDPWDEGLLTGAAKCTYFWQYIKHVAMQPQDYLSLLDPWRNMIEMGFSTTPETPEPSRSDCHGWSAHPPLGLLQLVAGLSSAERGWSRVRISPKPGDLKHFKARIEHPNGPLSVQMEGEVLAVDSPVPFNLEWFDLRDERFPAGTHRFDAKGAR